MSFADLKRKSQSNFEFLQKELEKSSTTSGGADERLWKPELDATGNGYAVIRFLPAPEGEAVPWAKLYSHAFQGTGGASTASSEATTQDEGGSHDRNRQSLNPVIAIALLCSNNSKHDQQRCSQ